MPVFHFKIASDITLIPSRSKANPPCEIHLKHWFQLFLYLEQLWLIILKHAAAPKHWMLKNWPMCLPFGHPLALSSCSLSPPPQETSTSVLLTEEEVKKTCMQWVLKRMAGSTVMWATLPVLCLPSALTRPVGISIWFVIQRSLWCSSNYAWGGQV